MLAGKDVLGQAATGTGKTAAFALPLLQRLLGGDPKPRKRRSARALVLVPTRELAMQVAEAVHRYGKALGVRAVPIYGGQPIDRQIRALDAGVDVVLATPGRALDHLRRRSLSFEDIEIVVVDEADEMLDMGFAEDLDAILGETPATRQTALFSATMPPRIVQITNRHLKDPVHLRIAKEQGKRGELPKVRQNAYVVARPYKMATLVRVLDVEQPSLAIVFCRTRLDVENLHDALAARGFTVDMLHGGMSQEQRDRAMKRFRNETVELLVATDVAARGLDVKGISHVVNYDVPPEPEDYIHRIGRTGRAGREGVAITLIEPREHRLLHNIERATGQRIDVASIPTVADLRARKLELTTNAIREALAQGELEQFRVVVDALSSEHDIVQVALAAVKLAHVAQGGDPKDEAEIPRPAPPAANKIGRFDKPPSRFDRPGGGGYGRTNDRRNNDGPPPPRRDDRGPPRNFDGPRNDGPPRNFDGPRNDGPRNDGPRNDGPPRTNDRPQPSRQPKFGKAPRTPMGPTAQMYVGAGAREGVRAKDLVGAIANEAGIEGRVIGAIQITDGFSLVELPADRIDEVIGKLGRVIIRGKKVEIRRS